MAHIKFYTIKFYQFTLQTYLIWKYLKCMWIIYQKMWFHKTKNSPKALQKLFGYSILCSIWSCKNAHQDRVSPTLSQISPPDLQSPRPRCSIDRGAGMRHGHRVVHPSDPRPRGYSRGLVSPPVRRLNPFHFRLEP